MDASATNYDPYATVADDDSCTYCPDHTNRVDCGAAQGCVWSMYRQHAWHCDTDTGTEMDSDVSVWTVIKTVSFVLSPAIFMTYVACWIIAHASGERTLLKQQRAHGQTVDGICVDRSTKTFMMQEDGNHTTCASPQLAIGRFRSQILPQRPRLC